MVSPSPDGTLSSETPLAAAAAVAAAAGTAVGFVTASNLTSSQHQQCSSITSTGLAAGDISAKNAAAVFSEINTGKNNIMYHLCIIYVHYYYFPKYKYCNISCGDCTKKK